MSIKLPNIKESGFAKGGNALLRRLIGFDFSDLPSTVSSDFVEIKGRHDHTIKDTAGGWVISAGGMDTNIITATTDISDLDAGDLQIITHTAAIDIDLDSAVVGIWRFMFAASTATHAVTVDVGALDYATAGVDRVFGGSASQEYLGAYFVIAGDGTGYVISQPRFVADGDILNFQSNDFIDNATADTIKTRCDSGVLVRNNADSADADLTAGTIAATNGCDVTTAALTSAAGLTVSGGAVDIDPTANSDFDVLCTGTGAISLAAADASNFTTTGANVTVRTATTGNVILNAADNIDIDGTSVAIDGTAASHFTVAGAALGLGTTTSGDVTISTTVAGDIVLNSVADIDVDSATLTADFSGVFSIDGVGASNVTTDTGNLTLNTSTSGDVNISSIDNILLDARSATGTLNCQLGTDTNATSFGVLNDTGANIVTVDGSGQADFAGNLDANLGLDVIGADFSFTGTAGSWTMVLADSALTQTGTGQVTFTGNVNADNGLDVTTAALTTAAGLTVSGGAVDIDPTAGSDFTVDCTTTGTISLQAAAASDFTTSAGALSLSGGGGITSTSTGGTYQIVATGQDIDIDSTSLTADFTGVFSIDGVGASNVTTSTGNLTLQTSASGDVKIDSAAGVSIDAQGATSSITNSLGTDTNATSFIVENNTGTDILTVDGAGAMTFAGTAASSIAVTGAALAIQGVGAGGNVEVSSAAGTVTVATTAGQLNLNSGAAIAATAAAASSIQVVDASLTLSTVGATGAAVNITATKNTITMEAGDNLANMFTLEDADGNDYVHVVSTTASEAINLGNAADNPTITTLGTGQITLAGNVDCSTGLDVAGGNITLDTNDIIVNTNKFTVDGATGDTLIAGDLSLTGHKIGQKRACSAVIGDGGSGIWVPYADTATPLFALGMLSQNNTNKYGLLPCALKAGEEITGAVLTGWVTETSGLTLDAFVVKVNGTTGVVTEIATASGFAQVNATGTYDQTWNVTAAETVDDGYLYGIRLYGTTGATDTIYVGSGFLITNTK
jgi:hypothetical protein